MGSPTTRGGVAGRGITRPAGRSSFPSSTAGAASGSGFGVNTSGNRHLSGDGQASPATGSGLGLDSGRGTTVTTVLTFGPTITGNLTLFETVTGEVSLATQAAVTGIPTWPRRSRASSRSSRPSPARSPSHRGTMRPCSPGRPLATLTGLKVDGVPVTEVVSPKDATCRDFQRLCAEDDLGRD